MKSFFGKRIWIIGASTGIGRALAVELAAQGAMLTLSARDGDKLSSLNHELGGMHQVCPLDVTDQGMVATVAEAVNGPLDSVIYLAGSYQPMAMDRLDLAVCRTIIDTNLNGALNVIHAVLPILLAQENPGQIALCGSVAGYRGLPRGQPYSATKAALINLAESLRAEMSGRGLDVKIINPGFVRTPMTDKNSFEMPMMIEPDAAARVLARGLQSGRFEIVFPWFFAVIMKIMRFMPAPLFFALTGRSGKK